MTKSNPLISTLASVFLIFQLLKRKKAGDKSGEPDTNSAPPQTESSAESVPPEVSAGQVEEMPEAGAAVNHGRKQAKKVPPRRWRSAHWNTLFAGTLVFLTCVNVMTTIFQWQTSEKSLRISQRAYIDIHSIKANFQDRKIVLMLKNIGHVPADDLQVIGSISIKYGKRPEDEKKLDDFSHSNGLTPLFPGNLYTQITVGLEKLTEEDKNLIGDAKVILSIGVFISYRDGFGYTEKSDFGFVYEQPRDEWVARSTFDSAFAK